MDFVEEFKRNILHLNKETFEDSSIAAFDFQYHHCAVYRDYCNYLKVTPQEIKKLEDIPFLPIEFFKNHAIKSGSWQEKKIFKSSGTTATGRSRHFIKDPNHYHQTSKHHFESIFGSLEKYTLIALLPSYQEQGDSSLISMVDYFMRFTNKTSGYFQPSEARDILKGNEKKIVIGVSYALLDLAEKHPSCSNATVIETGGMKGRRKEIIRAELHKVFKEAFGVREIWSEYGMTELLSQAYGKNGVFHFSNWSQCLIRDINDPFTYLEDGHTGGINVIDLANIDTCCFIETKDLGRTKNKSFEVLGRFDNSDIRGCNLMI